MLYVLIYKIIWYGIINNICIKLESVGEGGGGLMIINKIFYFLCMFCVIMFLFLICKFVYIFVLVK